MAEPPIVGQLVYETFAMGDLSIPPSHIRLSNMEERLRTFIDHNWPYNTSPVPPREALARAGFIYRGENLAVQCFLCNVVCTEWQYGDTAIKKHRDLNPYCPFVLQQSDIFSNGHRHVSSQQPANLGEVSGAYHPNVLLPEYMRVWPNHEFLIKESERLKTYGSDWPHISFIRPEDLARAGFVSLRSGDRVQCIFCRGIVVDWEMGDIPFQEHCRHFPSCPFVRGDKTRNISLKNEIRSMSSEAHRPSVTVFRGFDVCGSSPLNMNSFRPEREGSLTSPSYDLNQLNIIEHALPLYQSYATRAARTKSFETWPKTAPQYLSELVDAGFFYTGTNDHVKCFQCGGGLKNWEATDVPDEEHARWHPTCSFVLLNKGKEYIERTKKMKPPVLTEPAPASEPKAPLPATTVYQITHSELDRLMESDVAKVVLEMGLDSQKIREILRMRWEQAGYNFPTAESLANAVLESEHREPSSTEEQSSSASTPVVEMQMASTSKEAEAAPLTSCSTSAPVFQGLKGGAAASCGRTVGPAEQEFRLCKVCMEQEICIVFLPCGHFVACVNCATSMRDCPLCRATIKGSVRMYWP